MGSTQQTQDPDASRLTQTNTAFVIHNGGQIHGSPELQYQRVQLEKTPTDTYAEMDDKKKKNLECQTFKTLVLENIDSICNPLEEDYLSFGSIPDYDYGDGGFYNYHNSWNDLLGPQHHNGYYDDGASCRVDLNEVGVDPLKYDVNPVTHEVRELTQDEQITAQIMHDSAATVSKATDLNMVSNIVKDVTQQPLISTNVPLATDFSNASAGTTPATPVAPQSAAVPTVQQPLFSMS